MNEKPILFSGSMVRAILNGRKTQTRRVVKHISSLGDPEDWCHKHDRAQFAEAVGDYRKFCPHGIPGTRLWVRETFRFSEANDCACYDPCSCEIGALVYRATANMEREEKTDPPWKPSIYMPRWASRITLEITGVRVERIQDIIYTDCEAEGLEHVHRGWWVNPYVDDIQASGDVEGYLCYKKLWNSINEDRGFGWEKNPWVWVISFKKL